MLHFTRNRKAFETTCTPNTTPYLERTFDVMLCLIFVWKSYIRFLKAPPVVLYTQRARTTYYWLLVETRNVLQYICHTVCILQPEFVNKNTRICNVQCLGVRKLILNRPGKFRQLFKYPEIPSLFLEKLIGIHLGNDVWIYHNSY